MKTLREYIDQLDEISRRDFLKGAGATLGAAALGSAKAGGANLEAEAARDIAKAEAQGKAGLPLTVRTDGRGATGLKIKQAYENGKAKSQSQSNDFDKNEANAIGNFLTLYYICKNNASEYNIKCADLQPHISRFINGTPGGVGKDYLNSFYRVVAQNLDRIRTTMPDKYKKIAVNYGTDMANDIIAQFDRLSEFKESIAEEDLGEDATPDAVARILELSKNK